MEENSEDNKENYSLLDEKRKEQIILELKKEINEQIIKNSKVKDENNNDINNSDIKELFEKNNDVNNNQIKKNMMNDNDNLNKINFIFESNLTFKEINNFIKENEKNINDENNNKEENKENEVLELPKNDDNNLKLNNSKKLENNKNLNINIDKQASNIYLNKIQNKKNILFYQIQKKKKLISNNSFNITKKKTIINNNRNKLDKNTKPISKAKSTEKIKLNKNKNTNKKAKTNRHQIIPNEKSKEKYKNIKIEINNKVKEEHPFKPKINSSKNKIKNKLIMETKEEKYIRLSRPKIFEIKGIHMIKTEESKLQTEDNINKKKKSINKINPKEVSNRLYKLHQQIKDKKEQVKKIFEKKELDKCSFYPEINTVSKKIMNKTSNNLSFNERNENYIKHKQQSILKLREEIDKKIESTNQKKVNTTKNDDTNVYDRLYENNYYSNMVNINIDKNDIDKTITQKNNSKEIQSFLERQKVYENIKQEHINKYKLENNINHKNEENDELTFKPKINSTSELIARTNPERIGEVFDDKFSRLYNEAEILKNKKEQLVEFYNAQYNFTPTINEISKLIGNNYSINNKNDSYYMNNNINNNTLQPNECTFKPNLINNEKYNFINSNYKFDGDISKKIEQEIINRNNRINQLKSEYSYNNQKECKFVPETNKNAYNLKKYYTNNDIYYQKSLKKHLDQMEKAKKAKKEKEELEKNAFITGENYNNEKISFKPFNLSKTNKRKSIDKIREEMKDEEMKECSFHPVTNETIHKNMVKKLLNEKNK